MINLMITPINCDGTHLLKKSLVFYTTCFFSTIWCLEFHFNFYFIFCRYTWLLLQLVLCLQFLFPSYDVCTYIERRRLQGPVLKIPIWSFWSSLFCSLTVILFHYDLLFIRVTYTAIIMTRRYNITVFVPN